MDTLIKWLSIDAPSGWPEAIVRTVKTVLIVFIVLQLKEVFESGGFDTSTNALDGMLVGAATLALNAIFVLTKPPPPIK